MHKYVISLEHAVIMVFLDNFWYK